MSWKKMIARLRYHPPKEEELFYLEENTAEDVQAAICWAEEKREKMRQEDLMIGKREKEALDARDIQAEEIIKVKRADWQARETELEPILLGYRHGFIKSSSVSVSHSIRENAELLRALYHAERTQDLKLRFFTLRSTMETGLMFAYLDGMVDAKLTADAVMMPLMLLADEEDVVSADEMAERVRRRFLPMMQSVEGRDFGTVTTTLNKGGGVLFVEGCDKAFLLELVGYPRRAVGKAEIEETVRGSQAAFTESMRGNISQVRSMLRSENLVAEVVTVGGINRKECALLSVAGIANPSLVKEIKRRITDVAVDHVFDCGALMQYMTTSQTQFPQTLTTERPDRTVEALMQGRVVILLEGDPFAAILPVALWDFFHSTEDYEMRPQGALFMRVLRYLGAVVTVLLPAIYIAMTYFHQEAIPSQLLVVIAGYRQMVPFPSLVEMLLLIVSFEFIREATLRVPGRLGGSISIVGAIILGQAAVTAKLVSPVLVVVVALTGLASYILPEYRFAFSLRICQYVFLVVGAMTGLVGISIVFVLLLIDLAGMDSFGMPFLSPIVPRTALRDRVSEILGGEATMRPDALNPMRIVKQEHSGRRWQKEVR